jgi:1-acyl-sn-glycerol-3-phosphate acyltransferase
MNKPKGIPLSLAFKLIRFLCLFIFFPFLRKIRGLENLPKDKAFIVASNHTAIFEGLLLTVYLTRPIGKHLHFISKAKYYSNPLFRFLMETAQNIKLEESVKARSLFAAIEYLKHREIIGIFPEATRSPDGKIRKGQSGVAALALTAKVPVVPVGLINTYKILPRGRLFPQFARCEMNIGKPLEFEEYCKEHDEAVDRNDQNTIRDVEEKVVRIIMREIARLSNQEYPF